MGGLGGSCLLFRDDFKRHSFCTQALGNIVIAALKVEPNWDTSCLWLKSQMLEDQEWANTAFYLNPCDLGDGEIATPKKQSPHCQSGAEFLKLTAFYLGGGFHAEGDSKSVADSIDRPWSHGGLVSTILTNLQDTVHLQLQGQSVPFSWEQFLTLCKSRQLLCPLLSADHTVAFPSGGSSEVSAKQLRRWSSNTYLCP